MYPLSVILIGRDESALAPVRRELHRQAAAIEAEFPELEHALAELEVSAEEMHLFIFLVQSAPDLESLKRLSGTFIGRPVLALVEGGHDPAVLIHAMRAGAAQVVPLPLQGADFKLALDCIAVQFGHRGVDSQLIAVSGVVGGCGATTIALNLAYETAHLRASHCILVELALKMGTLAYYLNIEPPYTTEDLFRMGKRLDVYAVQKALTHYARRFDVLCGCYRAVTPFAVSPKEILRVLDFTRPLAPVVVLDVPCTYDDLYFETLATAHQIVLVADQKVPSIRALRMLSDTLAREGCAGNQHVVINRYDAQLPGFSLSELAELLEKPQLLSITNDFATVTNAIRHGLPLRLETSASPALADVDKLASKVLGLRESSHAEPTLVPARLGRLVRAFDLA